ncbi:uncharacterized protein LOC110695424 [Chenopodium quinoa]|uniref:uncharacterized protein LOC110695424 n=1 Tax=Chenopodium quinoa TaxID=63459 RepID=UPI000B78B470|nr:uncharacterized protein LOC110695424 [Chenopodium quinoa]
MINTRSANKEVLQLNPEIERIISRLRKEARTTPSESTYTFNIQEEEEMADNQNLRELTAPNLNQQPLCIAYQQLEEGTNVEIKSGLIHLLPAFHGMKGEDPNKHLAEFHVVCTSMKPIGMTDEQIQLRAFPFSLKDAAKDWFYYLPPGSITAWADLKKCFLEKYYPATISASLKKAISNVDQKEDESLYEYWERFKRLCASCPYHGGDLILYFYGGLTDDDLRMVNAASGGGLVNKTPGDATRLIAAENSRQFSQRTPTRRVNAANSNTTELESQVADLTSMMREFMVNSRNPQQLNACGICTSMGHPTDACPTLQEEQNEQANAMGFQGQGPQRRYDPYSNTYNPGWRDHPNLRYGNIQGNQQHQNSQGQQQFQQYRAPFPKPQGQSSNSGNMSTEEMIRSLTSNVSTMQQNMMQFQQETKSSIQNLENQVSQISSAVSRLEAKDSGKHPSQTELNLSNRSTQ